MEQKEPFFSIIIPCYNLEKYIGNTIKNVLKQTFFDYELILIDDGSADRTLEIINKFKNSNKKIKVITQKNKGVSSARNQGIENALGKYIYFLDGDDEIKNNLLEKAYNVLNKNEDINIFSFAYSIIFENKKKKNYINKEEKKYSANDFLKLYFDKKIFQNMCSFIISRNFLNNNNIRFKENMTHGEDQIFQITCLLKNPQIYYTSKIFFHYLIREGSAVNKEIKLNNLIFLDELKKLEIKILDFQLKQKYYDFYLRVFFYTIKEIAKKGVFEGEKEEIFKKIKIHNSIFKNICFLEKKRKKILYKVLKFIYLIKPEILFYLFRLY